MSIVLMSKKIAEERKTEAFVCQAIQDAYQIPAPQVIQLEIYRLMQQYPIIH